MLIQYTPVDEWQDLLLQIADHCSTSDGHTRAKKITPSLSRQDIENLWAQVLPLKELSNAGYEVRVGDIQPVEAILEAAGKSQILTGEDLRCIFDTLDTTQRVSRFARDFSEKCETLATFAETLDHLPDLHKMILRCINPDGSVKDDATPTLLEIRRKKVSLRKGIEEKIQSLFQNDEHRAYIQDEYFTIRSDRYVIPLKLDGRGRVAGSIIDTSASGQTLFIEPEPIRRQNESIQEVELAEKLEIIRIFKQITGEVQSNSSVIDANYESLIALDLLSARAKFAQDLDASAIEISDRPLIDLIAARHPLVKQEKTGRAVANDINLTGDHRTMIVSGPNAGGKTIVLKTVGMLQAMLKAGFLLPAEPTSKMYLFDQVYFIMGDSQNIEQKLSTFTGHIHAIKKMLADVGPEDLVLLDELANGTEPEAGASMAQAILEALQQKGSLTLATTHFERLKTLAIYNSQFRNASMQYSEKTGKPSFKLLADIPGQSLGLETAAREGLPASIIKRAEEIKGAKFSSLEKALQRLSSAESEAQAKVKELEEQVLRTKIEREHWEKERESLRKIRKDAAGKLTERYERVFNSMREDLRKDLKSLKNIANSSARTQPEQLQDIKAKDRQRQQKFEQEVRELEQMHGKDQQLPGHQVEHGHIHLGDRVYVVGLGKTGEVIKLADSKTDSYTVDFGLLQIRASLSQLRYIAKAEKKPQKGRRPKPANSRKHSKSEVSVSAVQTAENSLTLRGFTVEDALKRMWKFIDTATLRGDSVLYIHHGIGSNALKHAIHEALTTCTGYNLSFKSADRENGGPGTTIVTLG